MDSMVGMHKSPSMTRLFEDAEERLILNVTSLRIGRASIVEACIVVEVLVCFVLSEIPKLKQHICTRRVQVCLKGLCYEQTFL